MGDKYKDLLQYARNATADSKARQAAVLGERLKSRIDKAALLGASSFSTTERDVADFAERQGFNVEHHSDPRPGESCYTISW